MRAVVVGTGRIAPGVAAALTRAAAEVVVVGRSRERADKTVRCASALAGTEVRAGRFQCGEFEGANVVVECVVEDLAVKTEILRLIDGWLPVEAVLTTNTSGLSIASLGTGLREERFAGFHFLHPAEATSVVEVVPGPATAQATIEKLVALIVQMGRNPIVLRKDIPGFVWNRLQFAILRECLHLLDEGIADIESIDAAVSEGLAPRWLAAGPFATAELGGIETFQRVAQQLFPELSSSRTVSPLLASADRNCFYGWTDSSRAGIEELRVDALRLGRAISRRRRRYEAMHSNGMIPPARS